MTDKESNEDLKQIFAEIMETAAEILEFLEASKLPEPKVIESEDDLLCLKFSKKLEKLGEIFCDDCDNGFTLDEES